jgi:hypothetical protein
MNPNDIANRVTGFITWLVTNPFAALLWIAAAIIAVGLSFGLINQATGFRLPTFGIQAQSAIYAAGIVYLLHGRV